MVLDTSPALREVSVRSLISFAPKLSAATLNGKILQILGKCQTDVEAAIRTNTTVVIGEIAQYLSKEKQETILASAFTKPMKVKTFFKSSNLRDFFRRNYCHPKRPRQNIKKKSERWKKKSPSCNCLVDSPVGPKNLELGA